MKAMLRRFVTGYIYVITIWFLAYTLFAGITDFNDGLQYLFMDVAYVLTILYLLAYGFVIVITVRDKQELRRKERNNFYLNK